jgi:hypothetical protein
MRPRSAYEDGHDHIVDVPSYAVMRKFIGHYETHVDVDIMVAAGGIYLHV